MRPFKAIRGIAAVFVALCALTAQAWDGVVSGKIAQINGVGSAAGAPGNYDTRVFIEGQATICSGALETNWAYINSNEPNYQGLLSMLLMAQASGRPVTLYTLKSPSGYCQIGYLSIAS